MKSHHSSRPGSRPAACIVGGLGRQSGLAKQAIEACFYTGDCRVDGCPGFDDLLRGRLIGRLCQSTLLTKKQSGPQPNKAHPITGLDNRAVMFSADYRLISTFNN